MLRLLRSGLPPAILRKGRRIWSGPRYWLQWLRARSGYLRHGDRYPQSLLFVAGLPKSGTSWLESMLASFAGYTPVMFPRVVDWELEHGGSHGFPFPPDLFERLRNCLAVLKLHASGREKNTSVLHECGIRYVILYRDLRDVAVSHYFYVRRTPWHPEHERYTGLDVEQGLLHFADTLLEPFVDWIRSWRENRDPELSMVLTYEKLLADTETRFAEVLEHYGIDVCRERIRSIVDAHSFESQSGGRSSGEQDEGSFLRKGIAGDWRNHFTAPVKRQFDAQAGDLLDELGYPSTHRP